VLGDNRDDSMDSRAFGPVPRDHIVGVFNGLAVNN
jgi:type IV secretory pathway protease TraF